MYLSIPVTVIAPVCWITLYSLEFIGFGKILIFHTIWWYGYQGIWCVPGMELSQLRNLRRRQCILWRYGSGSALILHLGPGSGGSRTLWFPHLHTWVPRWECPRNELFNATYNFLRYNVVSFSFLWWGEMNNLWYGLGSPVAAIVELRPYSQELQRQDNDDEGSAGWVQVVGYLELQDVHLNPKDKVEGAPIQLVSFVLLWEELKWIQFLV